MSADGQSTWWPSELVPPLPLLVPWCLEALRLPDTHQPGRLRALRLLCLLLVRRQAAPVAPAVWAQLLRSLHRGLSSGAVDVLHTLVRQCGGAGLLPAELPAVTLLVLDLVQACSSVTASQELHGVSTSGTGWEERQQQQPGRGSDCATLWLIKNYLIIYLQMKTTGLQMKTKDFELKQGNSR